MAIRKYLSILWLDQLLQDDSFCVTPTSTVQSDVLRQRFAPLCDITSTDMCHQPLSQHAGAGGTSDL